MKFKAPKSRPSTVGVAPQLIPKLAGSHDEWVVVKSRHRNNHSVSPIKILRVQTGRGVSKESASVGPKQDTTAPGIGTTVQTTTVAMPAADPQISNLMQSPGAKGTMTLHHECHVCQRVFTAKHNLTRHLKIHEKRDKNYECPECGKQFSRNENLLRHISSLHAAGPVIEKKTYDCDICHKTFISVSNLGTHKRLHENLTYGCEKCPKKFAQKWNLKQHIIARHPLEPKPAKEKKVRAPTASRRAGTSALNTFNTLYLHPSDKSLKDLLLFIEEMRVQMKEELSHQLELDGPCKWYSRIEVEMMMLNSSNEEVFHVFFLPSTTKMLLDVHEIDVQLIAAFAEMLKAMETITSGGSGWTLNKIIKTHLNLATYIPIPAKSYFPLPKYLADKKALLNIKNLEDEKCFLWCLLAHKHKITVNPERLSHYSSFEHEIDMTGIEYPVKPEDIPKIESQNNMRINLYGEEEKRTVPRYVSTRRDEDCCNILLVTSGEKRHYVLIRDFSRLLGKATNHQHRSHICYYCLHRYSSRRLLEEHVGWCQKHSCQRIEFPEAGKNDVLKFKNINMQHSVPYVIYCDFECLLPPLATCTPSSSTAYSMNVNKHEPCGYSYAVCKTGEGVIKPPTTFRAKDSSEDVVEHFLKNILKERDEISEDLYKYRNIRMTREEMQAFRTARTCSICGEALGFERVKDHDHLTHEFRGAAHKKCNLQYKLKKSIPVIFHNLKKYDGNLIMSKLGKLQDHNISVIPSNIDSYISFILRRQKKKEDKPVASLQFIDSLQFLGTSLEKLVENLDISQFHNTFKYITDSEQRKLATRKSVYPYEYMTDYSKFTEKKLPPRSAFYSQLSGESLSDKDWDHIKKVWDAFKIEDLGMLHDMYVQLDVLLLSDVFEGFREMSRLHYKLDPAHFITAPSLAWQAALKETKIELDLFTDPNMMLFIEEGIRGGICQISYRHAVANNKDIPNTYDRSKPSTYIGYLDANNLYGYAMSEPLPQGQFSWMEKPEEVDEATIMNWHDEDPTGYILEVDLKYPSHLHDAHNEYPLAPERMKIKRSMLSPYAQNVIKNDLSDKFISCEKLVTSLNDKNNYIVHYRNLKLYLELGLKLVKVHKVLQFSQSAWLKPYIETNTKERAAATTPFKKDFFKLMINSVFGKTMENLRNRIKVDLVTCPIKARKLVALPTYKSFKIFNEGLVGVERAQACITMNKPMYIGFAVLELSKLLMYKFHYKTIKGEYGDRARLLFTDTDSLCYKIETMDFYADMLAQKHHYDFSDYPVDHDNFSVTNKKVIGKFKDELHSVPIESFVGLRPKMYSIRAKSGDEMNKGKGVSKATLKKYLKHADYLNCLKNHRIYRAGQMRIGHQGHNLYTMQQNKVTLSPLDDKRYLLNDGISSYAYGHYKINPPAP